MKILVTGATGYLGRRVVATALQQGHQVVACIRSESNVPTHWEGVPRLRWISADLTDSAEASLLLPSVFEHCDAVIHLAAAMNAAPEIQVQTATKGTENLLASIPSGQYPRLVLASSLAVYDYSKIESDEIIDEASPILDSKHYRDAYSAAKLLQESSFLEFCRTRETACAILRIGAVYGPGRFWTPRLGFRFGDRLWLVLNSNGQVPICSVDRAASALLLAAQARASDAMLVNVVDDEMPLSANLAHQWSKLLPHHPFVIPMPWRLFAMLVCLLNLPSILLPIAKKYLPGALRQEKFDARFKPFRFSRTRYNSIFNNTRADDTVG